VTVLIGSGKPVMMLLGYTEGIKKLSL